jgi:hypothetical protein
MRTLFLLGATVLVLGLVGASAAVSALAETGATRQHITITERGVNSAAANLPHPFTLELNYLNDQSGTAVSILTSCPACVSRVDPAGEQYWSGTWQETFTEKSGTLHIVFSDKTISPGDPYSIGTGPWRIVSGTGSFAGWKGGGEFVYLDTGNPGTRYLYYARFQGYVTR